MRPALRWLVPGLLAGCGDPLPPAVTGEPVARFDAFRYGGDDPAFAEPIGPTEYRNPIVAGFFPDPSIVRHSDDDYMVHSSFAYAPGVPILHSRN